MQDPSTKKEEVVKAAGNDMDEQVNIHPVIPITDDMDETDPDYLFHDMDGGEG